MGKNYISNELSKYFPASGPFHSVSKILQSNCVPTTTKYVPIHLMWLNRLFINVANQDEKTCLTIDCSGNSKNGPGRYRTQPGNPEKQVCYFNELRNYQVYNISNFHK